MAPATSRCARGRAGRGPEGTRLRPAHAPPVATSSAKRSRRERRARRTRPRPGAVRRARREANRRRREPQSEPGTDRLCGMAPWLHPPWVCAEERWPTCQTRPAAGPSQEVRRACELRLTDQAEACPRGSLDRGGDALRKRIGAREEGVVSGAEVDLSRTSLDASSLRLGGDGEVLRAHDVGGGLVLPGRRAGWLGERRHGLAGETFQGVPCRMLVAILQ